MSRTHILFASIITSLCFLTACSKSQPELDDAAKTRKQQILQLEKSQASPEALDRKAHCIAFLKSEGVPVMETLPVIDDSKVARRRSKEEVASRAIALYIVAAKGEGFARSEIEALIKQYHAETFFTPKEMAFIKNPKPTKKELSQFSWRYESYWVLLWSLGYIENLHHPYRQCDVAAAAAILKTRTTEQFIDGANLHNISDLLDHADLLYRYHWATVDARVTHRKIPPFLNADVIYEHHYALNWLIGYMDEDWDDVSTDT